MSDNKSELVEQILEEYSGLFMAQPRSQALKTNTCVKCTKPATEFTDESSKREYSISAMCEACQNQYFI